jgi:succinate dehydrogenase / fumarate reductase cytochrome b subunit
MSTATETIAGPSSQSRFLVLWQNPVAKKAVMAVTGLALFGFTLVHMAGNLQAFKGAPALDHYAELLRVSLPLLWTVRLILLASLLIHVLAAFQLWLAKRAARTVSYQDYRPQASSVASRSMMVSGLVILGFAAGHLMDLTFGTPGVAPRTFEEGRVFANLVASLSRGAAGTLYVGAVIGLGFHLWHGLWSVTQSLGFAHRGVSTAIQKVAIFLAVVLACGFAAVPVAVILGIVR